MPLTLEVSLNHWSLNPQTDFCFISELNPNCAEETRVDASRRAPFPPGCERGASSLAMRSVWPLLVLGRLSSAGERGGGGRIISFRLATRQFF